MKGGVALDACEILELVSMTWASFNEPHLRLQSLLI